MQDVSLTKQGWLTMVKIRDVTPKNYRNIPRQHFSGMWKRERSQLIRLAQPCEASQSTLPYDADIKRADLVIAIDDSGGIEALLDKTGNFQTSEQQLFLLGAYGIETIEYEDFNHDWNELRCFIKQELSLATLPTIHQRLMYGKAPPQLDRGQPNPFLGANFKSQILPWTSYAQTIMSFHSTMPAHEIDQVYMGSRHAFNRELRLILTRTNLWKDLRYFRAKFRSGAKYITDRLSSPIPRTLARLLGLINEHLILTEKTAFVIYDNFNIAQGVPDNTVEQVIKQLGFKQFVGVRRISIDQDCPLLQAADLYAYDRRRQYAAQYDFEKPDPLRPVQFLAGNPRRISANEQWDHHPFETNPHRQLILQYALLKEGANHVKNGRKVADLLVDTDEFEKRLEANKSKRRPRVSMLKDPSLSEKY